MVAKTALANGAVIENSAKFAGNDTFKGTVGIYRYSGHLYILILFHKIAKEITAVSFIIGDQDFHASHNVTDERDLAIRPTMEFQLR